jgi:hypothetical protein
MAAGTGLKPDGRAARIVQTDDGDHATTTKSLQKQSEPTRTRHNHKLIEGC